MLLSEGIFSFFRAVLEAQKDGGPVTTTIDQSVIRDMRAIIEARDAFRQQGPEIEWLPEDGTAPKSGWR